MERMESEQAGYESGAPKRTSHPLQEQKQEHGIDNMERQVGEVRRAGIQPEQLDIEHVGHPGQGMPIAGVVGGEGPECARPGQAGLHLWVLGDVILVVEIEELMA